MSHCDACGFVVKGGPEEWKKHRKTKSHKGQAAQFESSQRKVFVGDLPPWINQQHLVEYFSKFAPVVTVSLPGSYALVEFYTPDVVDRVVGCESHVLFGSRLKVCRKRFTPRSPLAPKSGDDGTKKHLELMDSLSAVFGVDEQMMTLTSMTKLTEDGKTQRLEFMSYLQTTLQQYIPEVYLVPYGSCVSGLGMQGCDVDLMVQYDLQKSRKKLTQAPPLPHLGVLKDKLVVANGRVTLNSLLSADLSEQVMFFCSALRSSAVNHVLERYLPIVKARVPLIRTHHKHGHFDIDLTFGPNSLAVVNTRLIQLLLLLDERVSPLVFTIKVWARQAGVSDGTPVSLSSYAFMLLIYVYLQNTQPPVLPTLDALASLCGPEEREFCMDMDCSFSHCVPMIQAQLLQSRNTQSLTSLLQGFFEFYTQKNLLNSVISVRSGTFKDVLNFRSIVNSSPHLQGFKIKDLNLQDPFELCHNTAGNVNFASARNISRAFFEAASTIQQNPGMWDLVKVIPSEPLIPAPEPDDTLVFVYQACHLPGRFLMCKSLEHAQNCWFDWILDIVKRVLSIFRVKFSTVTNKAAGSGGVLCSSKRPSQEDDSNPSGLKKARTNLCNSVSPAPCSSLASTSSKIQPPRTIFDTPQADLPQPVTLAPAIKQESTFECEIASQLWSHRKHARKVVDEGHLKEKDVLVREEEVTKMLLAQSGEHASCEPICFNINSKMYTQGHETMAKLTVSGRGATEFTNFVVFFRSYIQKLMKSVLNSQ